MLASPGRVTIRSKKMGKYRKDRTYSIQQGNNLAFGQGGVAYLTDTDTYTPPTSFVVIAISFIEDTVFTDNTTVESTNFTSNSVVGQGTNADSFGGDTFPAGLTIYGRFTAIDFTSGAAILYLGG